MASFVQSLNWIWEYFISQISAIKIKDILDILIVSIVIYYLIKFIRDRRAGKLAIGVVLLISFQFLGQILNLMAVQFIMQNVFQVGMLALVVVFQTEIRAALEKMGGEPLRNLRNIAEQKDTAAINTMINDLCEAVFDLSHDKTGALIVIERSTKLGEFIKSGVLINADISPFLLKNIFFNKAPLHDGAVIIRGSRIYAAGCFLPLSENGDIIKDLGTRHRAGIGMSEVSDAIILIVSEETGIISVAHEGNLHRNYDYLSLHRELDSILISDADIKRTVKRVFIKKSAGKSSHRDDNAGGGN